jgi:hypothetical protein
LGFLTLAGLLTGVFTTVALALEDALMGALLLALTGFFIGAFVATLALAVVGLGAAGVFGAAWLAVLLTLRAGAAVFSAVVTKGSLVKTIYTVYTVP